MTEFYVTTFPPFPGKVYASPYPPDSLKYVDRPREGAERYTIKPVNPVWPPPRRRRRRRKKPEA